MKKRMIIVIGAAVIIVLGTAVYLSCNRRTAVPFDLEANAANPEEMETNEMYQLNQLMGSAKSEEEAQETAALYGITLLEYQNGMALYETQEEPLEVIARGEKEGYPQLWLNYIRTAD